MLKMIRTRISVPGLSLFAALAFWACNVSETPDSTILRMSLPDSLATEKGLYDSVVVDLFDVNNVKTHSGIFSESYEIASDKERLANIKLKTKAPDPLTIHITAYKNKVALLILKINLSDNGRVELPRADLNPGDTGGATQTPPPTIAIFNPAPLILYVGQAPTELAAGIQPPGTPGEIVWLLPANNAAVLLEGDKLKGLAPGTVVATASLAGKPEIYANLVVEVQPMPTTPPQAVLIANPSPLTLIVGGSAVELQASVLPPEALPVVAWSLPPTDKAVIEGGNSIRGLKAGSVLVTASSLADPAVSSTLTVTVLDETAAPPSSVALNMPTPLTMAVSDPPVPLSAKVLPAGADSSLLWTSSDPLVAEVTPDFKVKALKPGKATLTAKSKADPALFATLAVDVIVPVKVDAISISPKKMTLYTGGADSLVAVTMAGTNIDSAKYNLTSSAPLIASVQADGMVSALKAGTALVTAKVVGSDLAGICTVSVITDPPVLTVTADQTIAFGAEATFTVSVNQAYGTVVEIKSDMDGDGVFEQSRLASDSALFKSQYTTAKTYDLKFEAKDSEGNVTTVLRKVKVNPPAAPEITVVDPASAITINQTSYTVRFSVKDPTKASDESRDSLVTGLISGLNTVVIVRSNAGGSDTAKVSITVDQTAPGAPVLVKQPEFTNDATPTWTWAIVPGAAKYQVRMADDDFTKTAENIEKTGTDHTPSTALPAGKHTLFVRSVDALGNASSAASQSVTIDLQPPAAVTFSGTENSYTADATPTWTWSPSTTNGGIDSYEVTLNTQAPIIQSGTTFTPSAALADNATHTLSVRQKDHVEGVWGAAKTFRHQVIVNAPAAPVVSSAAGAGVVSGALTNNPGFTWTNGALGNSKFRVKVNGVVKQAETTLLTYGLGAGDGDGTYEIIVQEMDALGRYGAEGKFSIILDRTPPKINIKTRNNFITNKSPVLVKYTVDEGLEQTYSCALTRVNLDNTCAVPTVTDAAKNTGSGSITVYFRPTTIFIDAKGTGDGSSWENASKDLEGWFRRAEPGTEFWVASGSYTDGDNAIYNGMTVLGGFQSQSFPVNTNNRNKKSTYINRLVVGYFLTNPIHSTLIDGLIFTGDLTAMEGKVTLSDCTFESVGQAAGSIELHSSVDFTANNLSIVDQTYTRSIITLDGTSTAVFNGGTIVGNSFGNGDFAEEGIDYAIEIAGTATFQGGVSVHGNTSSKTTSQILLKAGSKLTVVNPGTFDCGKLVNEGATGTCRGTPLF